MKLPIRRCLVKFLPATSFAAGLLFLGLSSSAQAQLNKAWSTTPADGSFSGTNWTVGTVATTPPTSAAASLDTLYFGSSTLTSLSNDLVGATYAGLNFNAGASAFTIGGNSFTLTGNIVNSSNSLQAINAPIVTTAVRTVNLTYGGGNVSLGGDISGMGGGLGIFNVGPTTGVVGTLTLSGNNSFTGGVSTGSGGIIRLTSSTGAGTGTIQVGTGAGINEAARLQLTGGITVANAVTWTGRSNETLGLQNVSGNNTLSNTITLTAGGVAFYLIQSDAGILTLGTSGATAITSSGRTVTFRGAGDGVVAGNIVTSGTVNPIVKSGPGKWTLAGANSGSGAVTVNGGTLQVGNGTAGSLATTSTLTSGGGTFNYQGVSTGSSQNLGALTFATGDGVVQSTYGTSGNTALTFASLAARTAGATGSFAVSGGANGTTNAITLTGTTAGFQNQGLFFTGTDYAYLNTAGGYVRAPVYGTDAGFVTAGSSLTTASHNLVSASIAGQTAETVNTVKFNTGGTVDLGLTGALTLTNGGLLRTGGGSTTVSGGSVTTGSAVEYVLRADGVGDSLTISSPIGANGINALTKSGAGTVTLSGANTYTGTTTVTKGTLNLTSASNANTGAVIVAGGTLNLSGTLGTNTANGNFRVGTVSGVPAVMNILPGANITNRANLFIGDAGRSTGGGAVYQSGGTLTLTQAANVDNLRIGSNATGYGYYGLSGGNLTANEFGVAASLADTVGILDVSGGSATSNGYITVGRGAGTSSGLVNVTGGAVSATRIELSWAPGAGALSVVNVGGGVGAASVSTTGSATLGLNLLNNNVAGTSGIANLLTNGTLTTGIVAATGGANPTALLNFNGGTLKATATNAGATFLTSVNLDGVYVYGGGGTIDNSGTLITVGRPILAPTGNGVNSIGSFTGGAGYFAPPLVTVSGGGGTGATALATINPSTGVITGVTITNPGVGYTSAPTFGLSGGGATTAATITGAAPTANVAGGLTFIGAGTTTLSGVNTFNGATVGNGTVATTGSGTLGAGNVSLTNATGVVLTLGNVDSFADTAVLSFGTLSVINLNFTGNDTLGGIFDTSTSMSIPTGVYTAAQLNSYFGGSSFADPGALGGTLTVVPEPSSYMLVVCGGLLMFTVLRRRRQA